MKNSSGNDVGNFYVRERDNRYICKDGNCSGVVAVDDGFNGTITRQHKRSCGFQIKNFDAYAIASAQQNHYPAETLPSWTDKLVEMRRSLATITREAINVSNRGYEIVAMKMIENDIDFKKEHILAFHGTTKGNVDRIINYGCLQHQWQMQEILEKESTVRECSTKPLPFRTSRRVNSGSSLVCSFST
jgi:hypothetical protein